MIFIIINQIQHELIPKHEILSTEEKQSIIEKLQMNSEKNLPHIFSDDPAIIHMSPKAGDLVRITRKSQTAGQAVYYRLVVE